MICVSEALGAIYLFRTAAMVPVLAVVGLAGWWVGRQGSRRTSSEIEGAGRDLPEALSSRASVVALIATSVLVAEWGTRTVDAFHHGMLTTDTLWYHMPLAARFVQQGTITPLHYADSGPVTVFFPASSELFHGLGILLMGNDVLSPLINLGWMALALLAAWCVGKPFGVAPVTLTGVVVLLATPGLVATQPGGAYDDVMGLALAALLRRAVGARLLRHGRCGSPRRTGHGRPGRWPGAGYEVHVHRPSRRTDGRHCRAGSTGPYACGREPCGSYSSVLTGGFLVCPSQPGLSWATHSPSLNLKLGPPRSSQRGWHVIVDPRSFPAARPVVATVLSAWVSPVLRTSLVGAARSRGRRTGALCPVGTQSGGTHARLVARSPATAAALPWSPPSIWRFWFT